MEKRQGQKWVTLAVKGSGIKIRFLALQWLNENKKC